MRAGFLLSLVLLVACDGKEGGDCEAGAEVEIFADGDGDGFGSESAGQACAPGAGQSVEDGDCDDADPEIGPHRIELCNGHDDDCDGAVDQGFNQHIFYQDLDGDDYGNEEEPFLACLAPSAEWTKTGGDCDDTSADVNPGAVEVCSGIDEDCDLLFDLEDDSLDPESLLEFYPDQDLDGYGATSPVELACTAPTTGGLVDNALDCNDRNDLIHPDALEVCNESVDDDCDGLRDDLDDSVDTTTFLTFNADADGDGAGDPNATVELCAPRAEFGVENIFDCDDTQATVAPNLDELLCDGLDNDCDPVTPDDRDLDLDGHMTCIDDCDDTNDEIYTGAEEIPGDRVDSDCDLLEDCYQDADGDGAQGEVVVAVAGDPRCVTPPNAPTSFTVDCDDTDPSVSWSGAWWRDADLDGFGDGVVALQQCADPGPGFVLDTGDADCDDTDPTVFPGGADDCNDGVDGDCDAVDSCADCATWLATDAGLPSGTYEIRPDGVTPFDVYCDMDTDDGGWTLVAATRGTPLKDAGLAYYSDLADLDPGAAHAGVWNGLRDLLPGSADMRFTCKLAIGDPDFEVDLSFYDVPWYSDITTGTDAQSCFSPAGSPLDPTPARRDNVSGQVRLLGDAFDGGALEGEDACGDVDDFTLDFDDAGMDGDQADGTDWGDDDGKEKCGVAEAGESWYIFAR
ncbi:MAG: hypothetical protein H0V89_03665 [Deltaproteobacteria bacterium]|nr:hypothetical protein [Deltaproteobacteria bacterium]